MIFYGEEQLRQTSLKADGNLTDGLHIIDNPIIPHWNGSETTVLPNGKDEIKLADKNSIKLV